MMSEFTVDEGEEGVSDVRGGKGACTRVWRFQGVEHSSVDKAIGCWMSFGGR